METFGVIIAMIMASVGLLLLLGSLGLLLWALWMRWYVEPNRQASQAAGPAGGSEAAQ